MWTKYGALRQASWALLNQPLLLGQGHPTCQGIPFSRQILLHSFFLSCCSNLDAPPTSNQNAKNNFAFSLLLSAHSSLQHNDCSSPGRVPYLVPPCQPRHAAPPCFSELGRQLWFLFPTMSNLEQVLVHPTQTFPEAILLLTVQVKVGHQHPPNLVYCHVLPLNGLHAPGQHTLSLCSFHLLPTSLLSLKHLSQYSTLFPFIQKSYQNA